MPGDPISLKSLVRLAEAPAAYAGQRRGNRSNDNIPVTIYPAPGILQVWVIDGT